MRTKVFLNEQHKLMEAQERLLDVRFPGWELYPIPAAGWDYAAIEKIANEMFTDARFVFASPVPALLAMMAARRPSAVYLLHNDKREKKELPGGKIISVVAQEGWRLVNAKDGLL